MEVAEHFYRTSLEYIMDGTYVVDRELNTQYWNRGAERISGYASSEARSAQSGIACQIAANSPCSSTKTSLTIGSK